VAPEGLHLGQGEDLHAVAEESGQWGDPRRQIDLRALDRVGRLTVWAETNEGLSGGAARLRDIRGTWGDIRGMPLGAPLLAGRLRPLTRADPPSSGSGSTWRWATVLTHSLRLGPIMLDKTGRSGPRDTAIWRRTRRLGDTCRARPVAYILTAMYRGRSLPGGRPVRWSRSLERTALR